MKILIANRGEIARRIIRTARRLGHPTVAVFAEPDRHAPFVRDADQSVAIGPAELASSYLSVERLLDAAASTGADAVHPGYGFLSENADFARAVIDAGLLWIGPDPDIVASMGSKIEARRIASTAGVPIIPGFDESQDPTDLEEAAARIGYPVLIKAAAGGGGKGIRIVHEPAGFGAALDEAMSESERSFGDRSMIVERFIQRPRHVEVQIIGDRHGNVVELGTRECSVQRRYQKLLEEAPAPNLPDDTRAGLRRRAAALARSIGYDSAGTVEFVVDDETGDFFFLEMNTRLQVEHPVTELVTGLDLVELMIRSADGEVLPLQQDDVTITGHAIEARVNAENPWQDFAPQIGTVDPLVIPPHVRWESGVEAGTEISPHYDAMVAKLIVEGADRPTALARLRVALDQLIIGGLVTNTGFHRWLIDQPPVVAGRVTTRFLDDADLPEEPPLTAVAELAALAWQAARQPTDHGPWHRAGPVRVTPHRSSAPLWLEHQSGEILAVAPTPAGSSPLSPASTQTVVSHVAGTTIALNHRGATHVFAVRSMTERWAVTGEGGHGHAGAVTAPFPALVAATPVAPGDMVGAGDVVIVIEAMKMLHSLKAIGPGVVAEVRASVGDQINSGQTLVLFEE